VVLNVSAMFINNTGQIISERVVALGMAKKIYHKDFSAVKRGVFAMLPSNLNCC